VMIVTGEISGTARKTVGRDLVRVISAVCGAQYKNRFIRRNLFSQLKRKLSVVHVVSVVSVTVYVVIIYHISLLSCTLYNTQVGCQRAIGFINQYNQVKLS